MQGRGKETQAPLKPSRYNLVTDLPGGSKLAFNASTAALVEIDAKTYPAVARILGDPGTPLSEEEEELKRLLVEGRYLIPAAEDEAEHLKAANRLHRTGNPTLLLTIAPTLSCNFDCDYCFQRHEAGRMTRETETALLEFAGRHVARSESLLVTWFGGEPTLCMPTIERIQEGLRRIAERHGAAVEPASIVTNGYFLDGAMATRLASLGIASAQVTLDGPARLHDLRRKLRGGQGTFQRILGNLEESAGILGIVVRVNVDERNMEAAPEVVETLEAAGLLSRVQIFFAPVNETEGACADMKARCYTNERFAAHQLRLYERLVRRGFRQIDYPDPASGGICGADTDNGFVVGPNGLLFKCWEELGLSGERSVGSIFTDEAQPHQRTNLDRYRSWDPFDKPGCVACEILPICMGGCPLKGLQRPAADRGPCSPWKYNLSDMLRLRQITEG